MKLSNPLSWLIKNSLALRRDQRGAAAIELALVAPLLGLIILGTVDIAQATAARYGLEQAAQSTTELAVAAPPKDDDDVTALRNEAVRASGQPAGNVSFDLYMECDGARNEIYNAVCGGRSSRYVSVEVRGSYTPIFNYGPFIRMLGGTGGGLSGMTLAGRSTVQVQ